mmetsp:Transcript_20018/g.33104  ORF Transcript_20018/g.33104 Transcript_20018/m.33104 type:complete len:152 (-) Transcript_20018:267-722(-)|eukprot:CAMPEP_0181036294 /NCGR_PEP_ID=MMETSP1070-20121207/8773_1 /TAXON_ID=265543 /ORGANISM="Minutocellus polymorphus, Strain NH13" /LENGTH=151 /DNA_ID=CAMNT_0023113897 /DNA_START=111 /DNA_END=566 /DNA_ORIENTATION=+
MKPRSFSLPVISLLSVIGGSEAYSSARQPAVPFVRRPTGKQRSRLHLTASGSAPISAAAEWQSEWRTRLATDPQVQSIREELVLKYLDQGLPQEEAEREVDNFLPSKGGRAYVEMRIYSSVQEEMGWETAFTYASAFSVGVAWQIWANYHS